MPDDTKTERKREAKAARAARQAAALRTNLHRRKAQARARRAPAEEDAGAACTISPTTPQDRHKPALPRSQR